MSTAGNDFYTVLSAAIDDMLLHGFDDIERVNAWTRKIRDAAEHSLIRPESLEQRLRDALSARYRKLVDEGEISRYHEGIDRFTLDRIKPALRGELDRRIAASANLIKLNRAESVEKTLRRFQGWSTSLPPGGISGETRAEVRTNVRASMKSLPFEERRVIIDQSHKLFGAINEIVASDGGAIAGRWRSNYRQPGYNYRPEHKERDNEIYLIRDSWAHRAGLVKKGGNPYYDEITAVGQEVFCRCFMIWIYGLRELPADMVTAKGKAALAAARGQEEVRSARSRGDSAIAENEPRPAVGYEAIRRRLDRLAKAI